MAAATFEEALKAASPFVLSPGCKTEVRGYYTSARVDRNTIPAGWHAYDMRHGDNGNPCTVEPMVFVNHAGTFLTTSLLNFGKKGYRSLSGRGGYSFV